MRHGKRSSTHFQLFVGMCLLLATLACSSSRRNSNLATVTFRNESNSSKTYDIIWDGSRVATLGVNQSTSITAAPGQHTLVFRVSNTSTNACTPSSPVLAANVHYTYSCTG